MSYFLLKHVFLCRCGDHVVLLDLKQQRYRALNAQQTNILTGLVPGWPEASTSGGDVVNVDGEALANELMRQGILSKDRAVGKTAAPASASRPIAQIIPEGESSSVRVSAGAMWAMLLAWMNARIRIRFSSLEQITRWARSKSEALRAKPEPSSLERTRELIRDYIHLRPLFFASNNACLFESLVLFGFLAHHGIRADWIFGVRMKPWLAHCWLQRDGIVLSDTLEHVSYFTPIMVV